MKLTEEQEEKIRQYVDVQGLKRGALHDDVIDHLCCVLEHEVGRGKSFEQSLHYAVSELAPHGLKNLEHQTLAVGFLPFFFFSLYKKSVSREIGE